MIPDASSAGDDRLLVVPEPVLAAADGATVTPVWLNEAGGVTYRLGDGPDRRFAKWAPHGSGLDLHAEEMRLRWAVEHAVVPRVLEIGSDDEGDHLVTAGLPGRSAGSACRAAAASDRRAHDEARPAQRDGPRRRTRAQVSARPSWPS